MQMHVQDQTASLYVCYSTRIPISYYSLADIFNASFQLGHFQKPWKLDNRIYVKKPGKDSYHTEKSYRLLSLTNIMGKLFERILMNRITRKLEETSFFKGNGLYA